MTGTMKTVYTLLERGMATPGTMSPVTTVLTLLVLQVNLLFMNVLLTGPDFNPGQTGFFFSPPGSGGGGAKSPPPPPI